MFSICPICEGELFRGIYCKNGCVECFPNGSIKIFDSPFLTIDRSVEMIVDLIIYWRENDRYVGEIIERS